MNGIDDVRQDARRRHGMRPNAHLYVRPDAWRFMPPGAPHLLGKSAVGYFWPQRDASRRTGDAGRKYSPDQPRVLAGNPDGGRWTSGSNGTGSSASASTAWDDDIIQIAGIEMGIYAGEAASPIAGQKDCYFRFSYGIFAVPWSLNFACPQTLLWFAATHGRRVW